jgi:membrane associated rhomboid family serine protease
VVNVAIFFLMVFSPALAGHIHRFGYFSTTEAFFRLEVWRLVTFQFLHADISHLFFNMFGLWVFGGLVEEYLGRKRYLAFYLVCGIFGGLLYLVLNLLGWGLGLAIPGVLAQHPDVPLIGASAGVFGVIVAAAKVEPNADIIIPFPPVRLPLSWFAYGYVLLALVQLLVNSQKVTQYGLPLANAGGDAAHIGGALAGYYFIRHKHLLRDFFDVFKDSRKARAVHETSVLADGPSLDEIDGIIAKVDEHGLSSLSPAELAALRRYEAWAMKRRA